MSGLEIFGAVGAAAALVELASKCSKRLVQINIARSDGTARDLVRRVELLTDTIKDVFVVLDGINAQNVKHHQLTDAESTIWDRMKAVLQLCQQQLKDLHKQLGAVIAKSEGVVDRTKEAVKLSVLLPNLKRIKDDVDTYLNALNMLKGLLQILATYRHDSQQRAMRRDIRDIKDQHGDKLDNVLRDLSQIKNKLQQRLPDLDRSDSVHGSGRPSATDDQFDTLSVHLEQILIAATDVKASIANPETRSQSSGFTETSPWSFPNSSTVSNLAEIQSTTSIQLPPDSLPEVTHIEPLQELARRFQEQARIDITRGDHQAAELHQRESLKCHEELHDAHSIPFGTYHEMMMILADILGLQKKFADAQAILLPAQRGRLRYDSNLGCRSVALDVDTDADCRAFVSERMANNHLEMQLTGNLSGSLSDAERLAKRAFHLRRETCGKESSEFKSAVKLLVKVYSRDPRNYMYGETYRDLYLSDHQSRQNSVAISVTSRSGSAFNASTIIEAIKDHEEDDVQEVLQLIKDAAQASVDLDETRKDKSAMMVAIDCDCDRCDTIVEKLLRLGAARDAPFQYAVEKQKKAKCSRLLRYDAAVVDKLDHNKTTPLMHAIKREDKEMVSFLIANKANLNVPGDNGRTALHIAIRTRSILMLRLLLEEKDDLDINTTDRLGLTPLHYCAMYNKPRLAKRLLSAGADPEVRDDSHIQRTALWIAVKEGKYEVAQCLLEGYAKVDLKYLPPTSGDVHNLLKKHGQG